MKKILYLTMWLMCIGTLQAQFYLTPEIGMTGVKRNTADYGWMDRHYSGWTTSWKTGVGMEYRFKSEKFALQSGLYFTQRAYTADIVSSLYSTKDDFTSLHYKETRSFLQMPLLAKFSWNLGNDVRLTAAFGPYFAYCIKTKSEATQIIHYTGEERKEAALYPINYYANYGYDGESYGYGYYGSKTKSNDSYLRNFDWGLATQIGLEIKQWVVNAGYELSLGKEDEYANIRANYHTVTLSVGYKFKLGK
ncbi:PorT family protein [Parabacteroides sp. 52]|uniref:porin family protein n=1 Tax=unclassified Parabacteroides TaxID=2649774 RepID=UPI0013D8514F|nr:MULTISPECIES: porin family protein [unclassified Parabacteroides]MDH6535761.1 hypothetical protein [Parabacteroides sp. PM5-20]NDV56423.1 PorT family protein [Parabacteroides sp. 52]